MATSAAYVDFDEGAAPATPGAAKVRVYAKADGAIYQKDDAGTESAMSAAGHIADTSDAHDASAISFTPAGSIAATDVQAAIEEVASEAGGNALAVVTVYRATDQNVSGSGTRTPISFSDEHEDTDGVWAIGDPTKFIIPAGLNGRRAILYGLVRWSASTSGNYRQVTIRKAGTEVIGEDQGPDFSTALSVYQNVTSRPMTLATGDEFELCIQTDTTGIGVIGGDMDDNFFTLYTID